MFHSPVVLHAKQRPFLKHVWSVLSLSSCSIITLCLYLFICIIIIIIKKQTAQQVVVIAETYDQWNKDTPRLDCKTRLLLLSGSKSVWQIDHSWTQTDSISLLNYSFGHLVFVFSVCPMARLLKCGTLLLAAFLTVRKWCVLDPFYSVGKQSFQQVWPLCSGKRDNETFVCAVTRVYRVILAFSSSQYYYFRLLLIIIIIKLGE